MSRIGHRLLLLTIAGVVIAIDQISKGWVLATLALGESVQPIPALYPFFQVTRGANTGAAFGIFADSGDLFTVIAVLVVIGLLIYYPRLRAQDHAVRIAIALVIGGALGNVIDRVQHGAVIDFIHYQLPGVISNVSNIADHAIVIGVIVWLIISWRHDPRADRRDAPADAA